MSLTASQKKQYLDPATYVGYSDEAIDAIMKEIRASEYEERFGVRDQSVFLNRAPEERNSDFIDVDEDDEYNQPEDIAVLCESNSTSSFFERYADFANYNTRALSQTKNLYNEDYDALYAQDASHNIEAIAERNSKIAFERRYHDIKTICLDNHNRLRTMRAKETRPRRKSKRITR